MMGIIQNYSAGIVRIRRCVKCTVVYSGARLDATDDAHAGCKGIFARDFGARGACPCSSKGGGACGMRLEKGRRIVNTPLPTTDPTSPMPPPAT